MNIYIYLYISIDKENLKSPIKAIKLDWFNYATEQIESFGKIDVVIGADIVFIFYLIYIDL